MPNTSVETLSPHNYSQWVDSKLPKQLSEQAIANIKANPASHCQRVWHLSSPHQKELGSTFVHPCGTAHCYAGHVDLILGIPNDHREDELYNDVRSALGLSLEQFCELTAPSNTIARIEALHKVFFVDGVYGENGFDADGKNRNGYTCSEVELEEQLYLLSDESSDQLFLSAEA